MRKTSILALTLTALIVSCAKDRPTQIAQAVDKNLLQVDDYQGRTYTLETSSEQEKGAVFSSAAEIQVEDGVKDINNFGLVSYHTESPMFEDVPFFGVPNEKYQLKYEVTANYLVINKIADKDKIPFQELTYATELEGGKFKVPLIGYPVSLYKLRRILNSNNEATHQLDTVPVDTLDEATHFRVDYSARKTFDAVNKNNVFKANLLDGEWFYAATVVEASPENANSIGRDLSVDFKARSVSRIKFSKRENSVVGSNLNKDENIDESDELNLKVALEIPANWLDFKPVRHGDFVGLKEEEVNADHNERRHYDERTYMKLDFAATKSILINDTSNAIFESLQIGSGYLSFVVYYPEQETKIRYALRKAHEPKEGRTYFKDDRKVFGFFSTRRYVIENHRYYRKEDYEKLIFMNRFYPKDGKIIYHFSHETPKHMRNSGRRAIQVWNEGFKQANTGIEILLDESRDVALGDIRFNIINIVDTKDGARLLGYGPSIVDSESGEIISATSNIYANPFRETWIETIRNYIKSELKRFNQEHVTALNPAKSSLSSTVIEKFISSSNLTFENHEQNELMLQDQYSEKARIYNTDLVEQLKTLHNKVKSANMYNSNEQEEGMFHFNSFDVVNKDAIAQIENECADVINPYLERAKSQDQSGVSGELEVLNECADRLLEDSVVATLVHELGHNFGLRHNFLASTDHENFIVDKDGTPIAKTSSTMEYLPSNVSELLTPGPYDIAALRFGYAAKVEDKNGNIHNIDTNTALNTQNKSNKSNRKEFKYCSDEHVERTNPLCRRHDFGVNPEEFVDNTIHSFNSSYTVYGNRYDRRFGPSSARFAIYQLQRTFIPLKLIYDQWRHHFNQYLPSKDPSYLKNISESEMDVLLERMKNDRDENGNPSHHAKNYEQYYGATKKIYNFLKEIIFTPALQCVVKGQTGPMSVDFIDFEKIKEQVFDTAGIVVHSCEDPALMTYFDQQNVELINHFGNIYREQRTSLDISDDDYNNTNAVGFSEIKQMALVTLVLRAPMMQHLIEDGFAPNFIDNEKYRNELITKALDRVFNGINPEEFNVAKDEDKDNIIFFQEKDFLVNLVSSLVNATLVPGDYELNSKRSEPFTNIKSGDPRQIQEAQFKTRYQNFYILAGQRNTVAAKMINTRNQLSNDLDLIDQEIVIPSTEAVKTLIGKVVDGFSLPNELITSKDFSVKNYAEHISKFHQEAQKMELTLHEESFIADYLRIPGLTLQLLQQAVQEDSSILDKPAIEVIPRLLQENGQQPQIYVSIFLASFIERNAHDHRNAQIQAAERQAVVFEKRKDLEAQLNIITELLLAL